MKQRKRNARLIDFDDMLSLYLGAFNETAGHSGSVAEEISGTFW